MEHIVSFLSDYLPRENHFVVEIAGITYPDKNYHIRRPGSKVYCLEYIMSGKGWVHCGEEAFYPREGDVYLLPVDADQEYGADSQEPFQKIWMNVRGTLCDRLYEEYGLRGMFHFKDCPLYPLFREFLTLCEQAKGWEANLERRGSLLFHEILMNLSDYTERKKRDLLSERKNPAEKARKQLDGLVYETVHIGEVARGVGLSPSQLTRVFQKEYGMTPYAYFLTRKLALAQNLLRNSSLPVREIADRLQFTDEHYFSALFRQKTGVSPGAYRRGANGREELSGKESEEDREDSLLP